jgi:SAM-dependent methyltransferase
MHQAMKPRGPMGIVMGWLLERGNADQNRATVEALAPPSEGAVLEVGFGPGHALELLAAHRRLRLVAGVDHSPLMVRTAWRRLTRRGPGPAVDLQIADAATLPFPDEAFDVAFAVNSYHQWPQREDALAEMAGVVRPGGEVVLSIRDFRVGGRFEPAGAGAKRAEAAATELEALGLKVSTAEILHSPERSTFLVRGRKAA